VTGSRWRALVIVAMLLTACRDDGADGSDSTGQGDDMDLSTAIDTTRSDLEAAVAAAASAGGEAGLAAGAFAVEERTDPCFAEMGGLSGEVQAVGEAVADAGDGSALDQVVGAVAAEWERRGYAIEWSDPPEGPAPLLFATASDGRKASLRYSVPKGDRPWQLRLGASSPCVAPDA
jgi:hypothetical protein